MCQYCGVPMERDRKPGFNEVCAECGRDLHVCLNCRFHRKGARWDCAETVDAAVLEKERRNHCDWYSVNPDLYIAGEGRRTDREKADSAKRGFDALFGGNAR
jgi:hypothetical protein